MLACILRNVLCACIQDRLYGNWYHDLVLSNTLRARPCESSFTSILPSSFGRVEGIGKTFADEAARAGFGEDSLEDTEYTRSAILQCLWRRCIHDCPLFGRSAKSNVREELEKRAAKIRERETCRVANKRKREDKEVKERE